MGAVIELLCALLWAWTPQPHVLRVEPLVWWLP